MTTETLHDLLDDLADSREVVLRRADDADPLLTAWRMAADDARSAYAAWCRETGPEAHAAYLAAADRADAAFEALAAAPAVRRRPGRPHDPRPLAA